MSGGGGWAGRAANRPCSVDGCDRPVHSREVCDSHRERKTKQDSAAERAEAERQAGLRAARARWKARAAARGARFSDHEPEMAARVGRGPRAPRLGAPEASPRTGRVESRHPDPPLGPRSAPEAFTEASPADDDPYEQEPPPDELHDDDEGELE